MFFADGEGIEICFGDEGGLRFLYDRPQLISGAITQDAWPIIIDALLTLIFTNGQGDYSNLFCL